MTRQKWLHYFPLGDYTPAKKLSLCENPFCCKRYGTRHFRSRVVAEWYGKAFCSGDILKTLRIQDAPYALKVTSASNSVIFMSFRVYVVDSLLQCEGIRGTYLRRRSRFRRLGPAGSINPRGVVDYRRKLVFDAPSKEVLI